MLQLNTSWLEETSIPFPIGVGAPPSVKPFPVMRLCSTRLGAVLDPLVLRMSMPSSRLRTMVLCEMTFPTPASLNRMPSPSCVVEVGGRRFSATTLPSTSAFLVPPSAFTPSSLCVMRFWTTRV